MKPARPLLYLTILIIGAVGGLFASSYIGELGRVEAAKANLYAAGESLRQRDLVTAMMHAQSALNEAPRAYSPYEAIGDIYVQFGLPSAARTMYQKAIDRLAADHEGAMLAAKGAVSPETAADLVRRKLDALPSTGSAATGGPGKAPE